MENFLNYDDTVFCVWLDVHGNAIFVTTNISHSLVINSLAQLTEQISSGVDIWRTNKDAMWCDVMWCDMMFTPEKL